MFDVFEAAREHDVLPLPLSSVLPSDSEERLAPEGRRPLCRPGCVGAAGLRHRLQHLWPAGLLPARSHPDPDAGPR